MTESERSVAVGSAAPEPRTNGHAGPRTALTLADSPTATAATVAVAPSTRVAPSRR